MKTSLTACIQNFAARAGIPRTRRSPARRALFLAALPVWLAVAGAPAAAQPAVEKVTVRAVARFDFDSAALREADRQVLLAEVAQLSDVSWQSVTATGYTDAVGAPAYNQRLAARRAEAVRSYLLSKGLDPAMVQTRALGPRSPVASNGDSNGRARNRRTVVQFEGVRSKPVR